MQELKLGEIMVQLWLCIGISCQCTTTAAECAPTCTECLLSDGGSDKKCVTTSLYSCTCCCWSATKKAKVLTYKELKWKQVSLFIHSWWTMLPPNVGLCSGPHVSQKAFCCTYAITVMYIVFYHTTPHHNCAPVAPVVQKIQYEKYRLQLQWTALIVCNTQFQFSPQQLKQEPTDWLGYIFLTQPGRQGVWSCHHHHYLPPLTYNFSIQLMHSIMHIKHYAVGIWRTAGEQVCIG